MKLFAAERLDTLKLYLKGLDTEFLKQSQLYTFTDPKPSPPLSTVSKFKRAVLSVQKETEIKKLKKPEPQMVSFGRIKSPEKQPVFRSARKGKPTLKDFKLSA